MKNRGMIATLNSVPLALEIYCCCMIVISQIFQGSSRCIVVKEIIDGGAIQLAKLNQELFQEKVNGN